MSNTSYIPPAYGASAFNCPHCNAFSNQQWLPSGKIIYGQDASVTSHFQIDKYFTANQCDSCQDICLWLDDKLIYPDIVTVPAANADLPEEVKTLYDEAAAIMHKSPRAAAALLRLALQHLCIELGGKGKNINDDIEYLRKEKRLHPRIIKAMDAVRIVGNHAVHPGVIDFEDSSDTANHLFTFINLIADSLITQEKILDAFSANLPTKPDAGAKK